MALIRIVRMVFDPAFVPEFLTLFHKNSAMIRSFSGCEKLELWRDDVHENIYYTHSHWLTNEALQQYRKSTFFLEIWKATKIGFADRPQAWSNRVILDVSPEPNKGDDA